MILKGGTGLFFMEEWQLMKAKGMAHSEKLPLCNHYCNKLFRLKSQFGSKKKNPQCDQLADNRTYKFSVSLHRLFIN